MFLVIAKMEQLALVPFLQQLVLQLRLGLIRRKQPHLALPPRLHRRPLVFNTLPPDPSTLSEWDLLDLLWQLEL
jgi:hypothetical protein